MYLFAHVALRWRNFHSLNRQRVVLAVALLALVPFADRPDALVTLGVTAGLMVALIVYEATRFAEGRDRIRHAEAETAPS